VLFQLQLPREETVDALSVAIVGSRRTYVEALLAFANEPVVALTPPLVRRGHLATRIKELAEEADMSRARLSFAVAALAVIVFGSTWGVVSAIPLRTGLSCDTRRRQTCRQRSPFRLRRSSSR